uniref:Uncharacterized protein n=1 Tax=Arundo donax TaxID=35708 RepID=A0A0A9CQ44_ARUDO
MLDFWCLIQALHSTPWQTLLLFSLSFFKTNSHLLQSHLRRHATWFFRTNIVLSISMTQTKLERHTCPHKVMTSNYYSIMHIPKAILRVQFLNN